MKALKCSACGGDIVKTHRVEGSGEDEEYIPIARCLSCGKEYDQYTREYYEYFSDIFVADMENTVFRLGLKGELRGEEYEIIGRIRYQEEEEYEVATWDEWLAVTPDGVNHWFVEEEGRIYSYEEYLPESIDLESESGYLDFEGKRVSREETGYVARIVHAEGELPWKPEIGEPAQIYEFKKDGYNFSIEQYEDEVSITRGEHISHKEIIEAFRSEDYLESYQNTVRMRKRYRWKALIYMSGILFSLAYIIWAISAGKMVPDVQKEKRVVTDNVLKQEEGGRAYLSRALCGPVELDRADALYTIHVGVDERVQDFHLEWQSYRIMLIKEERLKAVTGTAIPPVKLQETLADIDALEDPLESFVFSGDFWDEEGYDSDGYWHESDTADEKDFVLDDTGRYFVYLELYSQNRRNIDSVTVAVEKDVKSYRYFIIIVIIFFILYALNRNKSKTYNELPFEMSAY